MLATEGGCCIQWHSGWGPTLPDKVKFYQDGREYSNIGEFDFTRFYDVAKSALPRNTSKISVPDGTKLVMYPNQSEKVEYGATPKVYRPGVHTDPFAESKSCYRGAYGCMILSNDELPEFQITYHFRNDSQTVSYTQKLTLNPADERVVKFRVSHETQSTTATISPSQPVEAPTTFHLDAEAVKHLEANSHYYSQVIWANMDEADWMKALSNLTYQGKAVGKNLDNLPAAIVGNYVGFRWHFNDEMEKLNWLLNNKLLNKDFRQWKKEKGYTEVTEDVREEYLDEHLEPEGDTGIQEALIPMPTGGVFAEAVLGRFNCAEKLDITRFWNWQDSPIPIVPPQINPLNAGSHALSEVITSLKDSGLDPQAIHLNAPTPTLNAPTAAASGGGSNTAAINALVAGNMFRDMSNSAATSALAQQGLQTSAAGAAEAGQQTTEGMRISSQQQQQNFQAMTDLAGQILPMLLAPETGGASLLGNTSGAGAAMNEAQKLDESGGGEEEGKENQSTDNKPTDNKSTDNKSTENQSNVLNSLMGAAGAIARFKGNLNKSKKAETPSEPEKAKTE